MTEANRRVAARDAWRDRLPLVALLAANGVSLTGNVMALVAIPWFVLQTTGSPTRTGVTAFFNFLPVAIAGFLGGAIVDRLGYRSTSIVADVASGATVAAIPLLHATIGLEFWQLLLLVFLGGLLDSSGTTARAALIPDLAERAGWSLERASGLDAVVERGSRFAGAPLAGVLIALIGETNVLWVNAATFLISAVAVRVMVPRPRRAREPGAFRYLEDLKEGFAFLWSDRMLRALILTVTVTNFLDAASVVLAPVYAEQVFGSPVALGLMLGAFGAGSVVSASLFAGIGNRLPRRRLLAWCFLAFTLWYPIAATFPPLVVLLSVQFAAGAAAGPINPIIDTVAYERVPSGMRARVFGVGSALAWMIYPLGVLVAGSVVEVVGLRTSLLVTGGLYLATTSTLHLNRDLRDMDTRPRRAADPSPQESPANS